MVFVIATLKIKPGTREEVAKAAAPCIEATRGEAGCWRYELAADMSDPTRMCFIEEWDSREALEAHFNMPHVAAWREAREPFVESAVVEVIHSSKVETL